MHIFLLTENARAFKPLTHDNWRHHNGRPVLTHSAIYAANQFTDNVTIWKDMQARNTESDRKFDQQN